MAMFNLRRFCRICMASAIVAMGATSCNDSFLFDEEGDCSVHYRVGFRYTKNVLGTDAFGSQVTGVHLFVFDKQGNLIADKDVDRQPTEDNDFFIDLDVPPGTYDLMALCDGKSSVDNATSFVIGGDQTPVSITDLNAVLPLQGTTPNQYSDHDINRLYHGIATDVVFPDTYGTVEVGPVRLTRDTKHISVLLQNIDGTKINEDDFTFAIEASNDRLDYLNNVVSNTIFSYRPWSLDLTSATFDENDPEAQKKPAVRAQTEVNGLLAELTTGRLVAGRTPRLVIKNKDGVDVIRINLIQYLLMVKGKYNGSSSDQNYLDCYDDYTMMFFIQKGTWYKAKVYINGWRIVPPQDTEF